MTKQDLPVRSNCLKADQEEKKKEDDDEQDLGWSQGLIVWRGINKSGIPRFPFDPSNQQHEEDAMHEIKLKQRDGGTIGTAHETCTHAKIKFTAPQTSFRGRYGS